LAEKLRVHTLSKELGVTSKAIVTKCHMEKVEGITNHMSTVSAGLAETIREWFSEESQGTAVEEAAKVDLKKVRAKRRSPARRKKGEEEGGEPSAEAEAETAVEVAEPEAPAVVAEPAPVAPVEAVEAVSPVVTTEEAVPESPAASPVSEASLSVLIEPPAPVEAPPEAVVAPAEAEPLAPAASAPVSEPAPPPVPEAKPIVPAGPQNIPAPAQMKGPNIVGFAKPDPISRPVPRAPFRPFAGGGTAESSEADASPRRGGRGKLSKAEEDAKRLRARANPRRSSSSLNEVGERLREWRDRDLLERQERLQEATGRGIHTRRAREREAARGHGHIAPRKTKAQVSEPIVAHELCSATGISLMQLVPKFRVGHNILVTRNSIIPTDVAEIVMLDFGVELEIVKPKTESEKLKEEYDALERKHLQRRSPVVTMLGHVDHGKTSLLDAIRQTAVAAGEAGGITQHIGAHRVERGDLSVTFLDTPGHAAFTAMRARGAHMTDVVVLVVAADDGVMPQTVEAINHAKAAKVTIVVALNKIDLPGVDLNKIYGQLSELGLAPTEWGGDTDVIKTSATTGQGIEDLITHLSTLSELLDLQADATLPASGIVVEAQMQPGVGPMARILVREGTLRRGDFVVCGPASGRARVIRDDRGKALKSVGPAMPAEVAGLDTVPNAGDPFYVVSSLQRAKEIATEIASQRRQEQLVQFHKAQTLEDLFKQRQSGAIPELNLILRADVQGSVDALIGMLREIPSDEVKLHFLHTGIGSVTESDIVLAIASGAMVVGFNVSVEGSAQKMADTNGVDVRQYRIVYEVADDIRKALEGLLPRDKREEARGKAEVREIFRITRVGTIAGCLVTEGTIARSHMVRVVRDGQIIVPTADDVKRGRHRAIASLKRFKDDVRDVRMGMECGIRVEDFDDVKPGDVMEAYEVIETARTLT